MNDRYFGRSWQKKVTGGQIFSKKCYKKKHIGKERDKLNNESSKPNKVKDELTMPMSSMFLLNKIAQILCANNIAITIQAKLQK